MRITHIIDLSVTLDQSIVADPPMIAPKINYTAHAEGARHLMALFPGLKIEDLPDREGWAVEDLVLTTHSGTHMDAPWHYASTMNGGRRAIGIDEMPLEWCLRPGVKLDFRHMPDGHVVSAREIDDELARVGYQLQPLDIVLVNTAAGAAYGSPSYLDKGCGMGREATLHLLNQGVKIVGTDAWSWDAPFSFTRKKFEETGDASIIWEGHKAGRDIGYGQMEKLANLDRLPPFGFMVSCFPYKIKGASAGFTRAVALFEE